MSGSESKVTDPTYLLGDQYKTADNLRARMALHQRFSTNKEDFARWVFDHIEAPESAQVLELGTGPANFWVKNRERVPQGWRVTLTDLSPGMLEEARKVTENIDASFAYKLVDAQAIPFEADTFDVVIANHMLYHVPDLSKAVAEVRRVLKPGGTLYAATNGKGHMLELYDFVRDHLADRLPGVNFTMADTATFRSNFGLENGGAVLARQFDHVSLDTLPNNALSVTEAEPFMAYILSTHSVQASLPEPSKAKAAALIEEATREVERRLERGPIHITKATGLFVAF